MEEQNICDKCLRKMSTTDLIWIDSEDFKPLDKDNFNKKKYNEVIKLSCFSALCEECYKEACCN